MRPLIVHEPEEPVTVHVFVGSSTVVTVKYVGVAPVGCVTVTVACPSPATAVGADGVSGAVFEPRSLFTPPVNATRMFPSGCMARELTMPVIDVCADSKLVSSTPAAENLFT